MAEYLSPGVYVEEFESGGRPMEGISTSTAGFIGLASRGPVEGNPQLVTNVADFKRKYGGYLSENEFGDYRFLAYAVEHFFVNGGSRAYIMRVAPTDAKAATAKDQSGYFEFTAKNPGIWGNFIKITIVPANKAKTQIFENLEGNKYIVKSNAGFNPGDAVMMDTGADKQYNRILKVQDNIIEFEEEFSGDVTDTGLLPVKVLYTCELNVEISYDDIVENYTNVSFNIETSNYVEKKLAKSDLVSVRVTNVPESKLSSFTDKVILSGGSNGLASSLSAADFMGEDRGPGKRTGIQAFIDNDVVSIMAIPGVTDPNVQLSLVAHCENLKSRFAVLDIPQGSKKIDDVIAHRNIFDSDYAAMYHPWLEVFDPLDKKTIAIPPSGTVAGIYSRSDVARGVQKAPANEVAKGVTGLDCIYNKGEQDILNPKGVNLIRVFPGQGIRIWGARTCSSNSLWKYINVRRLFIFLEESIKANTNWVVFEPNDELLWVRVRRTIEVFLTNLWRNGAFSGTTPDQAFFVDIGRTTMTQDDIDNGRLICVIGVAPVKPAEFVIFRLTQKTNEQ